MDKEISNKINSELILDQKRRIKMLEQKLMEVRKNYFRLKYADIWRSRTSLAE